MDYIRVLGEYINKKENKKIDFKGIKKHPLYTKNLYSYGIEDFVIGEKREEVQEILLAMSSKRAIDYPDKYAKKYTHKKFLKAKEKRMEEFKIGDKKFFIVIL